MRKRSSMEMEVPQLRFGLHMPLCSSSEPVLAEADDRPRSMRSSPI